MSIADCIRFKSKLSDQSDQESFDQNFQQLVDGGVPAADAYTQAAELVLENLVDERNELALEINEAGGYLGTVTLENILNPASYFKEDAPLFSRAPAPSSNVNNLEQAFKAAGESTYRNIRQFKIFLQARLADMTFDPAARNARAKEYLVEIATQDAMYALKENENAVGWYDETVGRALTVLSQLHPEIATDVRAKFAFTYALAVTSNGQKVDKNFQLAERAYRIYKDTGLMPTNMQAGEAQAAINASLKDFNVLSEKWGIDTLRKFMMSKFTVSQIKRMGFDAKGELADTVVLGAQILGPKIGNGFFANLNGEFGQLTIDRWLMRTWGRWTGTLVDTRQAPIDASAKEFAKLLSKLKQKSHATTRTRMEELLGMSVEDAPQDIAVKINKLSMLKSNRSLMNRTKLGEEIRKSGNNLAKKIDGQKEAPSNGGERAWMREIFVDVLSAMQNNGYTDMTMSDLQALLWYPEKRLYDSAKAKDAETSEGYADDDAPDYANAAVKLVKANGVSQTTIDKAVKDESERRAARLRSRSEPDQPGSDNGREGGGSLNARERRTFLRNNLIARDRAGRRPDAKTRTYTKASSGTLGSLRGLIHKPSANYTKVLDDAEVSSTTLVELEPTPENAELFEAQIQGSKERSPFGAAVYVYPLTDTQQEGYTETGYESMRLFLTEDAQNGFAIKPDGDIVSVFSGGGGSVYSMLSLAVEQGGTKLDAFDTVLPAIYRASGFKESGRDTWNEDYSPDSWDKEVFSEFNNGEPDIVYMGYEPQSLKFSRTEESISDQPSDQASDQPSRKSQDARTLKEAIERYLKGDEQADVTEAQLPIPIPVIAALEKLFGKRIVGVKLGGAADFFNGVYIPQNADAIYVAVDSNKPHLAVIGHELLHAMKRDNPKMYTQLKAAMMPLLRDADKYKAKLDKASMAETGREVSYDLTVEEIIADAMGDNFANPDFWNALVGDKKSNFKELLSFVREFLAQVRRAINPLGHDQYVTDVDAVRDILTKAVKLHASFRLGGNRAKTAVAEAASNFSRMDYTESYENADTKQTEAQALVELERASSNFLSSVPAGIKFHPNTTGTSRAIKKHSNDTRRSLGESSDTPRNVKEQLGPFTSYGVRAEEGEGLLGDKELHIKFFGKEQTDAGFTEDPALTIKIDHETHELSIYGPPFESDLYNWMAENGWAETAKDATGEPAYDALMGMTWTRMKDVKSKELYRILGEAHGRLLTWKDQEHAGIYWTRSTGSRGGTIQAGTATYFSRTAQAENEAAIAKGLDMSKPARMARAKAMGFDTSKVYYHGTPDNREILKDGFSKKGAHGMGADVPLFFSTDKRLADSYADDTRAFDYQNADPSTIATHLKITNPKRLQWGGRPFRGEGFSLHDEIDAAKAEGFDAVIVDNIRDSYSAGGNPSNVTVVFEPNQVRSVNAAFDPEQADSSNLMFSRRDMGNSTDVGFIDKLSTGDKLKQLFVDKFHTLAKVQGTLSNTTNDVKRATVLFSGKARAKLEDFEADVALPLAHAVKGTGRTFEEVGEFLHARHAKEANQVLKRRNPDRADNDALSGMSDQDAQRILDRYRSNQRMQRVAVMADNLNRDRVTQLVADGMISQSEANAWQINSAHYVPLHREDMDQALSGHGQGFDSRKKASKVRVGSTREVDHRNLVARMVAQSEQAIVSGEKNAVAQTMYQMAVDNPNADLWSTTQLPQSPYLKADGTAAFQANTMSANVLAVRIDGEVKYVTFNPDSEHATRAARALKNLDDGGQNKVTGALLTLNRYLSTINTSLSPEFVISNFFRDLQTAGYNLTDTEVKGMEMATMARAPKAMAAVRSVIRGDGSHEYAQAFRDFRKSGGMTGWIANYDSIGSKMKQIERSLVWETTPGLSHLKKAWGAIEDYNNIVENGVRLSTFISAKEKGLSDAQAARLAKEVTVDFNRKGEWGTVMNAAYLFYNASVQGSARLLRAAFDKKNTRLRIMLGTTVAFATALDMLNRSLSQGEDDDESEYDKIPSHIRDRNLIIWDVTGTTENGYFKIPLPWGYNIFHIAGQEIGRGIAHSQGQLPSWNAPTAALRMVTGTLGAFNPVQDGTIMQTLAPTAVDPLMRIAENTDWHGGDLYPNYNKTAPNYTKFYGNAREGSKEIAAWLNEATMDPETRKAWADVSPEWIDMSIDFFTGSVGRVAVDSGEFVANVAKSKPMEWNQIPIARKLIGEVGDSATRAAFYDAYFEILDLNTELSRIKRDDGREAYRKALDQVKQRRRLVNVAKSTRKQLQKLKTLKRKAPDDGGWLEKIEERERVVMERYMSRYREVMYR